MHRKDMVGDILAVSRHEVLRRLVFAVRIGRVLLRVARSSYRRHHGGHIRCGGGRDLPRPLVAPPKGRTSLGWSVFGRRARNNVHSTRNDRLYLWLRHGMSATANRTPVSRIEVN
jgi:hypothetical protein